jgi:hypothetical protein
MNWNLKGQYELEYQGTHFRIIWTNIGGFEQRTRGTWQLNRISSLWVPTNCSVLNVTLSLCYYIHSIFMCLLSTFNNCYFDHLSSQASRGAHLWRGQGHRGCVHWIADFERRFEMIFTDAWLSQEYCVSYQRVLEDMIYYFHDMEMDERLRKTIFLGGQRHKSKLTVGVKTQRPKGFPRILTRNHLGSPTHIIDAAGECWGVIGETLSLSVDWIRTQIHIDPHLHVHRCS